MLFNYIITILLFFNVLYPSFENFASIPIQESGRIKPLDTYARNQLLLIYGKDEIKEDGIKIEAIEWLLNLLTDTENELNREVFFISSWSNSPEVEISLGLDVLNRESHRYSFYEIINGFKDNKQLLESLKIKEGEFTYVEKQIISIYEKIIFFDDIAHSFKCMIPSLVIENEDIRRQLKLKDEEKVSYSFFVRNIELFSPLMKELLNIDRKDWSSKHVELSNIAASLQLETQFEYAKSLKIFPVEGDQSQWLSPWEIMDHSKITAEHKALVGLLEKSVIDYINKTDHSENIDQYNILVAKNNSLISNSNLDREVAYNNSNYFFNSLIMYILSFLIIGISWMSRKAIFHPISLSVMTLGMFIHAYGILIRMIIMQRPPVTTLYESILFVCFVLVLISIIIEYIKKDSFGILIGSIGAIILHFIGFKYASDGDTLGMLVAVLNSNFWLSIHVTTITFGYGVSIAAGLMAHLYLILALINPNNLQRLKKVYTNTYVLTLIALFFTLFGTILGGIWADQSWGRFWGWDPKENGALLIVMWHLMMLHMRVAGMVKQIGFSLGVSLVNIIVALAWFGVNLLSVGLHSYGFTDSIANNLFIFISIELTFCFGIYFYVKLIEISSKSKLKEI